MGYKFNPFTGNFDTTDSPDGVFDSVQVNGDINLDDGGTYATTLQLITPTANRTISFPDATGTVGLVGGSSGQLVYNNAGAYAGAPSTSVGATGNITLSLNGAADTPPLKLTGTWFSGGTSTTTKPQFLIEPTGTTSTAWSTSGTGLGVNAASGFTGNLLDLQVDGSSHLRFAVGSTGALNVRGSTEAGEIACGSQSIFAFYGSGYGTQPVRVTASGGLSLGNVGDTTLVRDAANTFAQRNGTNAQTYRLYNTYTDASNYQRTSITDDSTGLVIDQQYAGTGAARTNLLDLQVNGAKISSISPTLALFPTGNASNTPGIAFVGSVGYGIGTDGSNLALFANNIKAWNLNSSSGQARLPSGWSLDWSSSPTNLGGADIGLKRDQSGVVAITNGSTGIGYLKQTPVAVSALPAAATVGAGTRGFVSDSTVAASGNFGATVAGGGSNNVPVFSDGTNWLIG